MSIRHYLEKFLLLTWKLHKTQWNRHWELIWVLISPMLTCLIAYYFRTKIDVSDQYNVRFDPVDLEQTWNTLVKTLKGREDIRMQLNKDNNVFMPRLEIGWAPSDYNIFQKIMDTAITQLHSMKLRPFLECRNLEQVMQRDYLFVAICFDPGQFEKVYEFMDDRLAPQEVIQTNFNYTITYPSELRIFDKTIIGDNWKTIYVEDPKHTMTKRLNDPDTDGLSSYFREGFINVQMAVSQAYLKLVSKTDVPAIKMRRFPVNTQRQERLLNYINRTLPLMIVVGFLFPAQILVWQVVQEKQRQMRLFLINMNFGNIIHYSSWFFKGLIYMLISSVGVMIILKIYCCDSSALLTQTSWHNVFLILSSYNVAATSFSLMIASLFKNSALAMRVLTLLWLLTYMPYCVLWSNREQSLQLIRYIAYVMPNTLLALILEGLIEREIIFEKIWTIDMDKGYTLRYTFQQVHIYRDTGMFLITALVYCGIGVYMDVWNTGETTGRRRKHVAAPAHSGEFTFQEREDSFVPQVSQTGGVKSTKIYEVEPSHRRFKIKIKKLCKRFTSNTRGALNSFTWNVYENEVTVLMGHNGCGKTTLLKILAGLLEPTRGLVNVADYNIQTERHNASMQLGLALSDDLLLPDFSVLDQLRFICSVKGMSWKAAAEESKFYANMLQLTHVTHQKVRLLTSQERNLLSICCAFVGGSPIILIDDLQADLDLPTQSHISRLISEEKSRRTIILVSNSTQLANQLADRLAIMSNGELKCTGTKPFLRNMYGHGFRLTCVKGKAFDFPGLCELVKRSVPILSVESDIGYKVTFVLENKYEDKFVSLFDDLEEEMNELDIISFRLRDTSLDEIFLRFGSEEGDLGTEQGILIEDFKTALEESDCTERATGRKLTKMMFKALLYMRWIYYKRQLPITIIYVISLLMVTSCTFSTFLVYGKNYKLTPISYNLTQLHYINAFVETISDKLIAEEMQDFYSELIFWYDGKVKMLETDERSDFYLFQSNEFSKLVSFRYMFGASFGEDTTTVWWNNIPLHAAPFALNLVHNIVARRYFNEEASIDVTLNPLPFQAKVNTFPQAPLTIGSLLAINLSFMFANMWPAMAANHKLDRSYKRQQFLAGVQLCTYILGTAIYDLLRVIFLSLWLILMISVYLSPRHDFRLYFWVFLVLVMTGFSLTTLSYLFTTIFKASYYAFIVICFLNLMGILLFSISIGESLDEIRDWYKIFPQYTFATVLFELFFLYDSKWLCKDWDVHIVSMDILHCNSTPNCCKTFEYVNREYSAIIDMVALLLYILIPLIVFVMWEHVSLTSYNFLHRAIPRKCLLSEKQDHETRHQGLDGYMIDQTVIAERNRVEKLTDQERKELAAVCQDVGKSHGRKPVLIRIDFCINKSECIGIMGYNNAGKTLLVKMILGEMRPSHGKIWIGGYSMEHERTKCYPLMGYCSQLHHLPEDYTPRELLHTHAQLHGISHEISVQVCEALSHLLGFYSCYRQLVRICTTGQHRRIAFALAILGDPMLVCIDGPPGGIDPNGKRTLYTLTSLMQQRGCAFIYTNLSGLDCERMCERVPVLFDGQLWTMGTQSNRYKPGYLLEVRFKRKLNADFSTARSTWDRINQFPTSPHNKFLLFIQIKFPDATLQNQQDDIMTFFIPQTSTKFSEIFLIIRKDAFELNIEDFYITRNIVTGMHTDMFDRSALKIISRTARNTS